jgi:hypothetical protein
MGGLHDSNRQRWGACRFDLDAKSKEEGERVEVVCSPGTRTMGDDRNPASGGGARRMATSSISRWWWCSDGLEARERHGIER